MGTKVIALANQKGGVGKTTTAVNLSAGLTALRKEVLLIDLDPQANATSALGLEKVPEQSIYSAILGEEALENRIKETRYKRLDIVPGEVDLAGAEVDVARSDNYLHRVKEALRDVLHSARYDYIFLDCPPSLGILTMNALTAADWVILPIQCEYFALEGLSVITRLVQQLRDSKANPDLEIEGIVMTMYDGRTNLAQQVVKEVREYFAEKVYNTMIPRTIRLGEAPSHGVAIMDYDRHNAGSIAYQKLAKEFLKRRKADASQSAQVEEAEEPLPEEALS